MQLLLKNGRVVDPLNGRDEELDLMIVDGKIEKMGKGLSAASAQVIDLRGKIVAPGFLDMHVHFREPGFEYKETIASGCASRSKSLACRSGSGTSTRIEWSPILSVGR